MKNNRVNSRAIIEYLAEALEVTAEEITTNQKTIQNIINENKETNTMNNNTTTLSDTTINTISAIVTQSIAAAQELHTMEWDAVERLMSNGMNPSNDEQYDKEFTAKSRSIKAALKRNGNSLKVILDGAPLDSVVGKAKAAEFYQVMAQN